MKNNQFMFIFYMLSVQLFFTTASFGKKCLYVASYHRGYAWNDSVEEGLTKGLKGKCELRKFFMDTKRNPGAEFASKMALKAKQIIEEWGPDVVIVSDDNAVKYLLQAHYKDHKIPFVFCGVNWTAREYGLPYKNATGMVEINATRPLIEEIRRIIPKAKRGACLGANNETDKKVCNKFFTLLKRHGLQLEFKLVDTFEEWKKEFFEAQKADFIVVSTINGIKNFDAKQGRALVEANLSKLTVATYDWMIPFSVLAFTNIGQEQGEYAAIVTQQIFQGKKVSTIPIVSNQRWDIWINTKLYEKVGIELPGSLRRKAQKFTPQ